MLTAGAPDFFSESRVFFSGFWGVFKARVGRGDFATATGTAGSRSNLRINDRGVDSAMGGGNAHKADKFKFSLSVLFFRRRPRTAVQLFSSSVQLHLVHVVT